MEKRENKIKTVYCKNIDQKKEKINAKRQMKNSPPPKKNNKARVRN